MTPRSRFPRFVAAMLLSAALLLAPAFAAGAETKAGSGATAVASASACTKAKRAVKKARKAVKRAQKALRKARRSGSSTRVKKAKNKLKKAKKKLKKAKKRQRSACGGGGGAAWSEGRYQGTYAENNVNLAFNVAGGRVYTGPFDSFYIDATCHNVDPGYTGPNQTYTDGSAIEPVAAGISGGSFSGSGVYVPGGGEQIAWKLSGNISGKSISGGTFSVNYTDYYGNPCSGTTHFTAAWYGAYTA